MKSTLKKLINNWICLGLFSRLKYENTCLVVLRLKSESGRENESVKSNQIRQNNFPSNLLRKGSGQF